MIVGAAALTHTPLAERIRAPLETERAFAAAVSVAAAKIANWAPDLTVVFFPDHLNGFLYDLLPSFCVGVQAESIGDWGTIPGRIDVPENLALDCARSCLDAGVDVAIAYRMRADHGYAQVVESFSEAYPLSRTIPIFVNCAAPPLPTFARCRALGEAVGRWAERQDARVLLLASGGLSHDPPLPILKTAPPAVRQHLTRGGTPTHAERLARQQRVFRAGLAFGRGQSDLRALNPQWDQSFLDSLSRPPFSFADHWSESELTELAGRGAHEIRTWACAWTAANVAGNLKTEIGFSKPVLEWITACAVVTATPEPRLATRTLESGLQAKDQKA